MQVTTNATACFGDSGSPAFVRTSAGFELVGVDSRSSGEGDCGATNEVYTDVTKFRDFIAEATGARV